MNKKYKNHNITGNVEIFYFLYITCIVQLQYLRPTT